jgi:F-type H+-transporting ATPase subunit b
MNIKIFTKTLLFIFVGNLAFAATGGHGASGVPTLVYWQVLNVFIVIAGLVYFAKDAIRSHLAQGRKSYQDQAEKFLKTKQEAEEKSANLRGRLQNLERDYSNSLNHATSEAEKIKNQILADAQDTVRRIQQDANEIRRIEVEKAKRQIKEQIILEATQSAKQVLSHDVSAGDQQKLHEGFVHNIQSI